MTKQISMQDIISQIRKGKVHALEEFHKFLLEKYPDAANANDKLVLYATHELLRTNINTRDLFYLKLFNHNIFNNTDLSGYFLEEYRIRDGSSILLDAAINAIILKDTKINLNNFNISDDNGLTDFTNEIKKYNKKISKLDRYISSKLLTDVDFKEDQNFIIKAIANSDIIVEYELKYYLSDYKPCLDEQIKNNPNNNDFIKKRILIDNITTSLNNDKNKRDNTGITAKIKEFLKLQEITNSQEYKFMKVLKLLLYRFFSPNTYNFIVTQNKVKTSSVEFLKYKEESLNEGKNNISQLSSDTTEESQINNRKSSP